MAAFAALLASGALSAQERQCDFESFVHLTSVQGPGGRITYLSLPVIVCTDGTEIQADSAESFEASAFSRFFGRVVFKDGDRELRSDRAQYYERVGRLQAQGSVRMTNLADGSVITGQDLVLLQAGEHREEDDLRMTGGRPHASFIPRAQPDTLGLAEGVDPEPEGGDLEAEVGDPEAEVGDPEPNLTPFEVDGDMIHLVGSHLLQARGRVEIRRESLLAFGDSMEFRQDTGALTLYRNARILSPDAESGDTLDIRGDTVVMLLPNNAIDMLEARGRARLLADAVDMRGPIIRVFFAGDELDHIVAVRRPAAEPNTNLPSDEVVEDSTNVQPRALAEDFVLTGDSIHVESPGGVLETVFAAGGARGVSSAKDLINTEDTPELIREDWIEGQTITAHFVVNEPDSTASAGQSGEDGVAEESAYRLDRLVAHGAAKSFSRSEPDSGSAAVEGASQRLDFNYVLGDEIRIFMKDGEVERMEVDNAIGVFFQSQGRVAPVPPPDTTSGPRMGSSVQPRRNRSHERLRPEYR